MMKTYLLLFVSLTSEIREKRSALMKAKVLCALLLLSTISYQPSICFAQGSLTPPTGTPGPTMKSLDQIEPRTPISSLPYTISSPGSYYLTTNLTAIGSGAGITVSADYVTIDLNGFSLTGGGGGSVSGISVPNGHKNFCARNGWITGWNGSGISAAFVNGSLYENLRLSANRVFGLSAGSGCIVRSCVAQLNGAGIVADEGSTVVDCTAISSNGLGFSVAPGCTIVNCTSRSNAGIGVATSGNCFVTHCTSTNNTGTGIETSSDDAVVDCTVTHNGGYGVLLDAGSIRGCTVANNQLDGIYVNSDGHCLVVGNHCSSNNQANTSTNAGIEVTGSYCTVDSNTCTTNGNGLGIKVVSGATHNIIIRNSCSGNTGGNYQVGPSAYGPVIDMSAGGLISSSSGTVNPWTNWIY